MYRVVVPSLNVQAAQVLSSLCTPSTLPLRGTVVDHARFEIPIPGSGQTVEVTTDETARAGFRRAY